MTETLPEPDDGQRFYEVRAKGKGMKPNYWTGYVLATSQRQARDILKDGYPGISLGIQGIRSVRVAGNIVPGDIEDRIRGVTHPNAVVFRDGGEVKRIHRGQLPDA